MPIATVTLLHLQYFLCKSIRIQQPFVFICFKMKKYCCFIHNYSREGPKFSNLCKKTANLRGEGYPSSLKGFQRGQYVCLAPNGSVKFQIRQTRHQIHDYNLHPNPIGKLIFLTGIRLSSLYDPWLFALLMYIFILDCKWSSDKEAFLQCH